MLSSAAAAPIDALAPAPSPSVTLTPSWMRPSARVWLSACASVLATTKSTPSRALSIMLLTALPPAPPTPNTVIRGLSSSCPGTERLSVIDLSACLWGRVCRPFSASFQRILGIFGSSVTKKSPNTHEMCLHLSFFHPVLYPTAHLVVGEQDTPIGPGKPRSWSR